MHGIRTGLANLFRACTGRNQQEQPDQEHATSPTEGLRSSSPNVQSVQPPRELENYQISSPEPAAISQESEPVQETSELFVSTGQIPVETAQQIAGETLAETGIVRFFVRNTQGIGDQNAMLEALASLKRLGFQGRVECVVQDTSSDGKTVIGGAYQLKKLRPLFPDIDPQINTEQEISWDKTPVRFIPQTQWQDYLARLPEDQRKADLGISPIFGGNREQLDSVLNTQYHCIMQPYYWPGDHCVMRSGEVIHIEHQHPLRYHPMNLDYLKETRAFMQAGLDKPIAKRKAQEFVAILEQSGHKSVPDNMNFQQIIQELFSGSALLLPVYGIHHQRAMYQSPAIIQNIAEAMSSIDHEGRLPLMFVIGSVPARDDWLNDRTVILNLSDSSFSAKYEQAREEGKVVVINLKFLPKKAFETLVALSHYPVLLEGANLTNLMQQLGIPYLSVLPSGKTPLPNLDDVDNADEYRALEHMIKASKALKFQSSGNAALVASFLEHSASQTTGYKELSERLQGIANDSHSDQVLYSMLALGAFKGKVTFKET